MLTVFQYGDVRRAHRDGMSIREIARTFHHSRKKVRQILAEAEPRPYTRSQPTPAPVLGAFHGIIDAILADDENAPPKQRHTARQIFRRLCAEHGYRGSYDQVRRYVGQHRRDRRETFIPLAHDPGQRLEADFGHIYVDFPEGRKQIPTLLLLSAFEIVQGRRQSRKIPAAEVFTRYLLALALRSIVGGFTVVFFPGHRHILQDQPAS